MIIFLNVSNASPSFSKSPLKLYSIDVVGLSFKTIDIVFLKYKNRHIYFRSRFSNLFSDGEAEKAEWIDLAFQMLIVFSPFLTLIISGQDKV